MRSFWFACMSLLVSVQLFGNSLDMISSFGGFQYESRNASDVRVYTPFWDGIDLVVGGGISIPNNKDGEIGVNGLVGVHMPLPIVSAVDMIFEFNKPGADSAEHFKATRFVMIKNWLFPLTDQLRLGVEVRLLDIGIDGSKTVLLFSRFEPVIGVSLAF